MQTCLDMRKSLGTATKLGASSLGISYYVSHSGWWIFNLAVSTLTVKFNSQLYGNTLMLKLTDTLQPDWIHSCLYRSIPSEHLTDNTVSSTVTKHIHSQSLSCWWCSLEAALFPHSSSLCSCSVLVHQLIPTCTQEHSCMPDTSTVGPVLIA